MKKRLLSVLLTFCMVLTLLPVSAFATGGGASESDPGVQFTKNAVQNDDGSVTITMEAYATGETVTTTTPVPLDVVLVLDQSGSMAYDFNGESTNTNNSRRQHAMKQAVTAFIDSVSENAAENQVTHQIGIVTFGTKASQLVALTEVNEDGALTLKNAVHSLPDSPSGATSGSRYDPGEGDAGRGPEQRCKSGDCVHGWRTNHIY